MWPKSKGNDKEQTTDNRQRTKEKNDNGRQIEGMNRSEKQTFVEDLNKMFKVNTSVLLINFEGINVLAQSELRREISKVDSGYQVIKNRLALRAVENTSLEVLREYFQGPTAIAYTGGDPVALAKVLKNFIRDHPSVAFKAGVVEGKTFSASDVERLAKMPSRPELMSKLVYLLNAPLVRLATALQSPLRGLASVLKQLAAQMQASGEGATDDGQQTADSKPQTADHRPQTTDSGQAEQEAKEQEAAPEPKEQQAEEETPAPEVAEQEAKEQEATPEPEKPEAKEQETAAQEPEAQEETAPEPAAEEPTTEEPVAEEAAAPEAASEEKADEETADKEKKDEETKDS